MNKIIDKEKQSKTVDYADLEISDGFLYDGEVCIKTDGEQNAVSLSNGEELCEMCGIQLIPVEIEISFRRK